MPPFRCCYLIWIWPSCLTSQSCYAGGNKKPRQVAACGVVNGDQQGITDAM